MMDPEETEQKLDWAEAHAEGGVVRDSIRVRASIELGAQIRAHNLLSLAAVTEDEAERDRLRELARDLIGVEDTPRPVDPEPAPAE